jgi:hypothetical protein
LRPDVAVANMAEHKVNVGLSKNQRREPRRQLARPTQ